MANDLWATPQYIFDWIQEELGITFDLDVCANAINHKCKNWFGEHSCHYPGNSLYYPGNSLNSNWNVWGNYCWMNPPYSDPLPWVEKAYEESLKGCTVVCLLPADTSTGWFHEWVLGKAETRFVRGRIKFVDPATGEDTDQAPKFGSILAMYGPGIEPKVISMKRPDKPRRPKK